MARAAPASMLTMRACAYGERRKAIVAWPVTGMLSVKRPRPRSSARSSTRATARPLPKRATASAPEELSIRSLITSGLQRRPHLLVALRRPDARIAMRRCFVVGARDVERHAVLVDELLAVFRAQPGLGVGVDALQVVALGHARLHAGEELAEEGTRRRYAFATHRGV